MTYTYDDIVRSAQKAGVYEKFSHEDLAAMQRNPEYGMSLLGLLKDTNNATTEEQRLLSTEMVNRLRTSYGVTAPSLNVNGGTVKEPTRLIAPEAGGKLSSADEDTYETVLDDIVNQPSFEYDPENDPLYDVYAKNYLREGRRVTANTLAQLATMTGGRPSSYAVTAAQQAGNQYAAEMANVIPTLRQNAYTEYLKNMEEKRAIWTALQNHQSGESLLENVEEDSASTSGSSSNDFGNLNNNENDALDYDFLNEHGDGWIVVPGLDGNARISYERLYNLMKRGRILVITDHINGTKKYVYDDPRNKE